MPDEYMNLTDAEQAALGYLRPARARPAEAFHYRAPVRARNDGREIAEALGITAAVLVVFLVSIGVVNTFFGNASNSSRSTRTTVTASTAASNTPTEAPRQEIPAWPISNANQQPEYLPAAWDYIVAGTPIALRTNRSSFVVPVGTKMLRTRYTIDGESFVATLDDQAWGWASLNPIEPRQVPMQPRFAQAVARMRAMEVANEYMLRRRVVYPGETPATAPAVSPETSNRSEAVADSNPAQLDGAADRQLFELIQALAALDDQLHQEENEHHVTVQPARQGEQQRAHD